MEPEEIREAAKLVSTDAEIIRKMIDRVRRRGDALRDDERAEIHRIALIAGGRIGKIRDGILKKPAPVTEESSP